MSPIRTALASIALLGFACSDEVKPPTVGDGGTPADGAADAGGLDATPNPLPDSGTTPLPDSGTTPQNDSGFPPPACNPVDGSGCPTDRTCVFSPGSMAALCVDTTAPGVAFEGACNAAQQDCAPGYSCFAVQAGDARCFKLCDSGNDAHCAGLAGADPTYECGATITGSQWSVCTGVPVTVTCSPLQDQCPAGEYCDRVTDTTTGCITEGTGALGAACSLNNDMACARGGVCMGLGAAAPTCMKACDANALTGCGANETCLGVNVAGQRLDFGVCQGFQGCVVNADPAMDSCPVGQSCQTIGAAPTTGCRPEGTAGAGEACTNGQCLRGNVCLNLTIENVQTGFKCWEVCDMTNTCTAGACTGLASYDFDVCVP